MSSWRGVLGGRLRKKRLITGEVNALFIQGSSFPLMDKYLFWVLKLCAIISATFHNNPMYRYYNCALLQIRKLRNGLHS